MEKVKIRNIKTNVEKEVIKEIASDFVGTKEWEIVKEDEIKKEVKPKSFTNQEE